MAKTAGGYVVNLSGEMIRSVDKKNMEFNT